MLTDKRVAEEQLVGELFEQYLQTRDVDTRNQIVSMCRGLVHFLAKKFGTEDVSSNDLFSVGNIGLIQAVERFDPNRGVKFETYATSKILGEIRQHFCNGEWAMKVPRGHKDLSLIVSKAMDKMRVEKGEVDLLELAYRLEVSEEDLIEAIRAGQCYRIGSLDGLFNVYTNDNQVECLSLADFAGEIDSNFEKMVENADLYAAISELEPRERKIIYYRFVKDLSQDAMSGILDIRQMQVSRLLRRITSKLRKTLDEEMNIGLSEKVERPRSITQTEECTGKISNRMSGNVARVFYAFGQVFLGKKHDRVAISKKVGLSAIKTQLIIGRLLSLHALEKKSRTVFPEITNPNFFVDDDGDDLFELASGVLIERKKVYNLFDLLPIK